MKFLFLNRLVVVILFTSLFLSFTRSLSAQPKLEKAMIKQGLVDVQKVDPSILVELKYSTTDNFVGKDVYDDLTRAYLQPMTAKKLANASKYLQEKHPDLRLLVYDAARPERPSGNSGMRSPICRNQSARST